METPARDTLYNVQVGDGHYTNSEYLSPARWSTYSRIVSEVLRIKPKTVLEIGPGPRVVTEALKRMNFSVKTLDIDPSVEPDYLLSATDPNIDSKVAKVDLVIASEIFEHVRYVDFLEASKRLLKITDYFILTLPDTNEQSLTFGCRIRLPLFNDISAVFKLRFNHPQHTFDGEHYWEIGKRGYPIRKIRSDLSSIGWKIQNDFINIDNPYHHFFILKKI